MMFYTLEKDLTLLDGNNQTRFMSEAYFDATEEPYGYLFVDLKPNTPEKYRLRTNIFKGETPYAYIPKV